MDALNTPFAFNSRSQEPQCQLLRRLASNGTARTPCEHTHWMGSPAILVSPSSEWKKWKSVPYYEPMWLRKKLYHTFSFHPNWNQQQALLGKLRILKMQNVNTTDLVLILMRSDTIQMLHKKLECVIVAIWQCIEKLTQLQITVIGVLTTICLQKFTVLLCTDKHLLFQLTVSHKNTTLFSTITLQWC